ncbi:MAG: hypothetical protein V4727_12490 [Verrucomicrobiota bacterium]
MNRLKRTIISALAAGAICMALKASPYMLEEFHGDMINAYKRHQELAWFLSLAIPGVFISIISGNWAKYQIPHYAVFVTWFSGALFSVAMPVPALFSVSWSDGLTLWYVGFAVVAGGLWGWNSHGKTQQTGAQQVAPSNR